MKKSEPPKQALSVSLSDALSTYLGRLNGQRCTRLYQSTLDVVEKELIDFSLRQSNGNISAAAKMLGISRTTFARKMAAHNLRAK